MNNYYIKGFDDRWIRPAGWLQMPTITAAENKLAFLFAVYENEENCFTLNYGSTTCNYTVDWGDGTTLTINNLNAIQTKRYDYSLINSIVLQDNFGINYKQVIVTVTLNSGTLAAWVISPSSAATRTGKSQILESVLSHSHSVSFAARQQPLMESLKIIKLIPTGVVSNQYQNFVSLRNFEGFENIDTTNTTTSTSAFNAIGPVWQTLNFTWNSGASGMTSILSGSRIKKFGNMTFLGNGGLSTALSGCPSLEEIGDINLGNHNALTSMFINNFSLRKIGTITTGGTSIGIIAMFQNCYSLEEIVFTSAANVTSLASTTFATCVSLRRLVLPGLRFSVTAPVGSLQRDGILEFITSLGTASTTQNVTLTGNPGLDDLTAAEINAILTPKNWTYTP